MADDENGTPDDEKKPLTVQEMIEKLEGFKFKYSIIRDNTKIQNRIQALVLKLKSLQDYMKFVDIYFNEVDLGEQGEGMNLLRGNAYCDFIPARFEYYKVRDLVWEYLDKINLGLSVLTTIQQALDDLESLLDELQDRFDSGDYGEQGDPVDEDKSVYYGTKDEVKSGNGTLYSKDNIKKVSDTRIIVDYRACGIFVRVDGEIIWNILGGRAKSIFNGSESDVTSGNGTLVDKEKIEFISSTEFIIPNEGVCVGVMVGDELIYNTVGN